MPLNAGMFANLLQLIHFRGQHGGIVFPIHIIGYFERIEVRLRLSKRIGYNIQLRIDKLYRLIGFVIFFIKIVAQKTLRVLCKKIDISGRVIAIYGNI